ncbi:hypothetical protein [Brevundimonas denitrificans]|nr:hypothetical protein [Brevundimonas denitrificans]
MRALAVIAPLAALTLTACSQGEAPDQSAPARPSRRRSWAR